MSSIENLTGKIIADSEKQASEILEEARGEAARLMEAAAAEGEAEKTKIIAQAKIQAARDEQQIVVGKNLEIRDQNLAAKQQVLDSVFAKALEKLNAMGKEDYIKFLTGFLCALDLDGEELTVPQQYGITNLDSINAALQKAGKKGNLTLSTSGRKIDGGFVLSKNGIEQNNTFETLVSFYRYELEGDVLNTLYK